MIEATPEFLQLGPWNARAMAHLRLPWFRKYPTMLTQEEMHMLAFLTSQCTLPDGEIVDLGPFMGGSTVSLGWGLNNGPRKGQPIYSFDIFSANENQKKTFYYAKGYKQFEGNNIFPLFKQLMLKYNIKSIAQKSDIRIVKWKLPISILFIDLSKSWSINDHLLKNFFPALVPGAIIIQQDFMYARTPWVCSTMYALRDFCAFAGHTDYNSAIFVVKDTLPNDALDRCLSTNMQRSDILDSFRWARTLIKDYRALEMVEMMKNSYLAHPDAVDEAAFSPPDIPPLGIY